jgi:hypothetical protein
MDTAVEREDREAAEKRREAFRAAQKSGSNVYLFRRLKWGRPDRSGAAGAGGGHGLPIVDLLLVVVIVAALGFCAIELLG